MDAMIVVYLFLALITKHFVCDFLLQTRYQYANKGTYGHPGGLVHVAICGIGTVIALVCVTGFYMFYVWIAALEAIVHYHVDWAKMNMNDKWNLAPLTSEWFWILLGFDQWIHYLNYVAIIIWIMAFGAYYGVRF